MRNPKVIDRGFDHIVASASLRCDSGGPVSICIGCLRGRSARLRNYCRHAVQIRGLELHCFPGTASFQPPLCAASPVRR